MSERKTNYPRWIYHETRAPEGLLVQSQEHYDSLGDGWVDTPAKFGNHIDHESNMDAAQKPAPVTPIPLRAAQTTHAPHSAQEPQSHQHNAHQAHTPHKKHAAGGR